jgi:hypothetical protein
VLARTGSDGLDLFRSVSTLNRESEGVLCLEVERNQGEDECLEILHQIVEYTQSLRICRLGNIHQRANLRSLPG